MQKVIEWLAGWLRDARHRSANCQLDLGLRAVHSLSVSHMQLSTSFLFRFDRRFCIPLLPPNYQLQRPKTPQRPPALAGVAAPDAGLRQAGGHLTLGIGCARSPGRLHVGVPVVVTYTPTRNEVTRTRDSDQVLVRCLPPTLCQTLNVILLNLFPLSSISKPGRPCNG